MSRVYVYIILMFYDFYFRCHFSCWSFCCIVSFVLLITLFYFVCSVKNANEGQFSIFFCHKTLSVHVKIELLTLSVFFFNSYFDQCGKKLSLACFTIIPKPWDLTPCPPTAWHPTHLIRLQPLPGARKVPLGRRCGRRRRQAWRAANIPRLRTLHGGRLQNDNHRRRVSCIYLKLKFYSLHPVRAKYPWVGTLEDKGEGDTRSPHGFSLFMAGDSKMITVGGG